MCSKLNIKDQRRAAGFCPDFALKVMESQQKGGYTMHFASSFGSSVWEGLKGKMEAFFFFLSKFAAPSISSKVCVWDIKPARAPSLFIGFVYAWGGPHCTAPGEAIPSTDDLG